MPVEPRWPGLDEKSIVVEMLRDLQSEHWVKCHEFIKKLIESRCRDLPSSFREDAIQETMISIHSGLLYFRFDSKLTTWFTSIARNRVIDTWRKYTSIVLPEVYTNDTPDDNEDKLDTFHASLSRTPEEEYLVRERLEETITEIEAFIKKHAKKERNRQILQTVMFEGYSCEETARMLGIKAPVVSHVVRAARHHLRGGSRRRPPSSSESNP